MKILQDENRHLTDRMLRPAAEMDNRRKRELRTEAEAERNIAGAFSKAHDDGAAALR